MEKLTNEQKEAICRAFLPPNLSADDEKTMMAIYEADLRSAGLLEPEETAHQTAKRLWAEYTCEELKEGGTIPSYLQEIHNFYEQAIADRDKKIEELINKYNGLNKELELCKELLLKNVEDIDNKVAEIARLKATAWNDADMRYAAYWGKRSCAVNGPHDLLDCTINKMLASRRAEKDGA